ncbi:TetR/AcrR family transcriptional regulator [uncultured Acetobacteroides sp.]|uniref:TetR/AcrR family transcriptional regulator n=1 Tax=uncultured Acetobacteroides sp. TaxID=1760811 RepID=UPI0029F4D986|nr:TetR/AcrR family transcriptional regulator [uncultured Acetobacteroides sp.]
MKSRKLYYISQVTPLFLRSGASRLKVDEIAASVGVTKKTLYNYFESKQQLIECIIDEYLKSKELEIWQILRESTNPIAGLVQIGCLYATTILDCNQLITSRSKLALVQPMQQILLKHRNKFIDLIRHTFKKGIANDLFENSLDTDTTSQMYITMLEAAFHDQRHLQPPPINEQKLNKMLYYLIKGCCTPKGVDTLRGALDIRVESI